MNKSFDNKNYYNKFISISTLEKDFEKELIINAQNDNKMAQDKLILHNIKSIFEIVRPCKSNSRYDENDLFQEAIIGMIKAIKTFDLNKDISFIKYATYKIKKQVNKYIYNNYFSVRIPYYLKEVFSKIKKLEEQYCLDNNYNYPSVKQISKQLNISEGAVNAYYKYIKDNSDKSLDELEDIYEI